MIDWPLTADPIRLPARFPQRWASAAPRSTTGRHGRAARVDIAYLGI
jgi:hypothetical protein